MLKHLTQYGKEIRLCFRMGVTKKEGFRLASNTLRFHFGNVFRWHYAFRSHAVLYHVRLSNQSIPIWLRTHSGDFFVFFEIFLSQCYRIPVEWCSKVRTVVDLGANVGLVSLYYHRLFREARFVCVEPNTSNISLLQRNLGFLGPRFTLLEGAVSDDSATAHFDMSGHSWEGHLLSPEEGEIIGTPVQCFTVADIMGIAGLDQIDLLKIDIEGAERRVFRAAKKEWLKKVGIIIIELHPGYSFADFEADVIPFGFRVCPAGSVKNLMTLAVNLEYLKL